MVSAILLIRSALPAITAIAFRPNGPTMPIAAKRAAIIYRLAFFGFTIIGKKGKKAKNFISFIKLWKRMIEKISNKQQQEQKTTNKQRKMNKILTFYRVSSNSLAVLRLQINLTNQNYICKYINYTNSTMYNRIEFLQTYYSSYETFDHHLLNTKDEE